MDCSRSIERQRKIHVAGYRAHQVALTLYLSHPAHPYSWTSTGIGESAALCPSPVSIPVVAIRANRPMNRTVLAIGAAGAPTKSVLLYLQNSTGRNHKLHWGQDEISALLQLLGTLFDTSAAAGSMLQKSKRNNTYSLAAANPIELP